MGPCSDCKCPVHTETFTRDGAAPHGQPGGRGPHPLLPDTLWAFSPAWGSRRGRSVRRVLSQLILGSQQEAGMLEGLDDKAWHLGVWLKRVCPCVHMCVHVCQCMHACLCAHLFASVGACVSVRAFASVCARVHKCVSACVFVCTPLCTCA